MKRKQVLALLLSLSIVAGNVGSVSAADIVSDENGNAVFVEKSVETSNEGSETPVEAGDEESSEEEDESDTKKPEAAPEKEETKDDTSNKEETPSEESTDETEKDDTSNKEETDVEEQKAPAKAPAKAPVKEDIEDKDIETAAVEEEAPAVGVEFEKRLDTYKGRFEFVEVNGELQVEITRISSVSNEFGDYLSENIEINSTIDYAGQTYKIAAINLEMYTFAATKCKTLTIAEGINKVYIEKLDQLNLDKLNLPSTMSDYNLRFTDDDNIPYDSFFVDGRQWVKEIAFPNGSQHYKVVDVDGEKRIYETKAYETPAVGETFTTKGMELRVVEKDKKVKVTNVAGGEAIGDDKIQGILKDGVIPASVTYRGVEYTIEDVRINNPSKAKGLKELTLSEGIKSLTLNLYGGADSIKAFHLPASLEKYEYDMSDGGRESLNRIFKGLESINVASGNQNYASEDGVLYNKDKSVMIAFPAAKQCDMFVVPETVKKINELVIMSTTGLKGITVGSHVETIEDTNISFNSSIETVEIHAQNIGESVVSGLTSLKTLTVDAPATLDEWFGTDCPQLESVTLFNIEDMEPGAFKGSNNIKGFYGKGDKYYGLDGVLYYNGNKGDSLVKYPSGCEDELFVVEPHVTGAFSRAFDRTQNLKEIVLPDNFALINGMIQYPDHPIDIYIGEKQELVELDKWVPQTAAITENGGNVYVPNQKIADQIAKWDSEHNYNLFEGFDVSVKHYPVSSVDLLEENVELKKGQSYKAEFEVDPYFTTAEPIWTSANESIATVDAEGNITGVRGGHTSITLTVGEKTDTMDIFVKVPLDSVAISETEVTLNKGDEKKLSVVYNPDDTTDDKSITWESSNDNVVTVDKDGKIHAVGAGTATITASCKTGKPGTCKVTVKSPLKSISLNKENVTMNRGEDEKLTVSYNPEDTTDSKDVAFESNNTDVVTVDAKGNVHAKDIGTAVVTVKGANGTSDTCTFEVKAPLKSIALNKEKTTIHRGEEEKLTVSYNPKDTTDSKEVTWTSSNKDVATVDANGNITAKGIGETTITVKGVNDTKATCKVTVDAPLKSITLNKESMELNRGESGTLDVTFNPDDTTDSKKLTWESSNDKIVTVKDGKVTAKGIGTATITVKGANGTSDTCEVTVKAPLKSITLNKESMTVNRGKSEKLNVTFNPEDTTDSKELVWESSNKAVATVDENGNVKAVGIGTATITVKGANGTSDTCEVTVKAPLESIALNKENVELNRGESETLNVTFNPDDTTDSKEVTWESSDKEVATVDKNGKITAKAAGVTTITVKGANGTMDTCKVTVKAPLESISLNQDAMTLNRGKKATLKVTFNPDDTTDSKEVTWETSDKAVAIVKDGVVTAVGIGTATITVKGANETVDTCIVTVKAPLESIALNKEAVSLKRGESETLFVSYNPEDTTDSKDVTWSTSNDKVAVVKDGKITAKGIGTATITVNGANGTSAACKVTVVAPLESISVNKEAIALNRGESETLKVTFNPEDTTDSKELAWESSDSNIASVKDGKVTAKNPGTATITVKGANNTVAVCKVTVKAPLESIGVDHKNLTMVEGGKQKLNVIYNPHDTTDAKDASFVSDDTDIATVDKDGNITAIKPGTATITVTVGKHTATCKVTVVKKEIALESITLNAKDVKLTVEDTKQLSVKLNPENTTVNRDVTWKSSDESVVTVDENGLVKAVGAGTAKVTATVAGKSDTCTFTVKRKEVALESIALNKTALDMIEGDKEKLTVSYNPTNTTVDKTVNWTSSNKEVVTVDKDGNLVAVKPGTATITATVAGKKAACVVTVARREVALESITLNATERIMGVDKLNDTFQLAVTYNPTNTTVDRTVAWESGDESIVTVDKNGLVKAVGLGTTTVTATVDGKTVSCTIHVEDLKVESITLDKEAADMKVGEDLKLHADIKSNLVTYYYFKTSDESIATVDMYGNVHALKAGTVTITAMAGDKTATCVITVSEKEEENQGGNQGGDQSEKPNGGNDQNGNKPNGNKPNGGNDQKPEAKPETKPESDENNSPKTSDPAALGLWGMAMALSGGLVAKLRRKKKDDK